MPAAAQAEHPPRAHRGRREVSAAQEGRLALLAAGLAVALGAAALEPQWPPPESEIRRMRELQAEISSRDATPAQREAARRELARLLMAPGAAAAPSRAPRAAIEPSPPIAAPAFPPPPAARVDSADVARLEVVEPSRAIVNPRGGTVVAPTGSTVIDLRTGTVLQETPSGWIDPRTGQLITRARN